MRRGPSWHSAKEAPQLDLNGGKCSENAHLSNRTIIVFLGDLGGILHRAEHGHRFRHVSNPPAALLFAGSSYHLAFLTPLMCVIACYCIFELFFVRYLLVVKLHAS